MDAITPVNYGALLSQIDVTPLQRGLAILQDRKAQEEALALRTRQFEAERADQAIVDGRRQAFLTRWKQVADAPSTAGYSGLRADFPDQLSVIDAGQKPFDDQQRAVGRDVATGIHAHILAGDNAAALTAIDNGIAQFGQAGRPVASMQTLRAMLASGKPAQIEAARRVSTMMLAQESGDNYGSVFGSLSREQQDSEMLPDRLRRADADADYAETRAQYAPAQQQASLRGRQVRTANTASLLHRREAPRPAPTQPAPKAGAPVSIRPGERTAKDGKGGVFVVRGGQWVKAR